MKVYLSAAPTARRFCQVQLISGFEAVVPDDLGEIEIEAVVPPQSTDYSVEPTLSDTPAIETVRLLAKPTGQTYRTLPWWEVRREEDW